MFYHDYDFFYPLKVFLPFFGGVRERELCVTIFSTRKILFLFSLLYVVPKYSRMRQSISKSLAELDRLEKDSIIRDTVGANELRYEFLIHLARGEGIEEPNAEDPSPAVYAQSAAEVARFLLRLNPDDWSNYLRLESALVLLQELVPSSVSVPYAQGFVLSWCLLFSFFF